MIARADELRKQVNELWKQAIDQFGEVKQVVTRSTGRFERDFRKLRSERDKLLRKLSEQSYRLADQDRLPVPAIVRRSIDRLNEVIESIVTTEPTPAAAGAAAGMGSVGVTSAAASSEHEEAVAHAKPAKKSTKKSTARRPATSGKKGTRRTADH